MMFKKWWKTTHWSSFNPARILYVAKKAYAAGYKEGCRQQNKIAFKNECLQTFNQQGFYNK